MRGERAIFNGEEEECEKKRYWVLNHYQKTQEPLMKLSVFCQEQKTPVFMCKSVLDSDDGHLLLK